MWRLRRPRKWIFIGSSQFQHLVSMLAVLDCRMARPSGGYRMSELRRESRFSSNPPVSGLRAERTSLRSLGDDRCRFAVLDTDGPLAGFTDKLGERFVGKQQSG